MQGRGSSVEWGTAREEQGGPGGSLTSSQWAGSRTCQTVRILWALISNYVFFLEAEEDTIVLKPKERRFEKTLLASINQAYQIDFIFMSSK